MKFKLLKFKIPKLPKPYKPSSEQVSDWIFNSAIIILLIALLLLALSGCQPIQIAPQSPTQPVEVNVHHDHTVTVTTRKRQMRDNRLDNRVTEKTNQR